MPRGRKRASTQPPSFPSPVERRTDKLREAIRELIAPEMIDREVDRIMGLITGELPKVGPGSEETPAPGATSDDERRAKQLANLAKARAARAAKKGQ